MVRTFFIIFMVMENRREVIQQIHQELKGRELGQGTGVLLYDFSVEESKKTLPVTGPPPQLFVLRLLVKNPEVNEQMIHNAMAAYYEVVKDAAAVDSFRIESIMFSGGMEGLSYGGVNILEPQLNLMPAYIRHSYVLPSFILTIPEKLDNSTYWLNEAAVEGLSKFFSAAGAQTAMINKAELRLKQLRRGSIKVKSTVSEDMITIHYVLPEDAHLEFNFDVHRHYKIKPELKFDGTKVLLTVSDQNRDSFLAMEGDKLGGFQGDVVNSLASLITKYGLEVTHEDILNLKTSIKLN